MRLKFSPSHLPLVIGNISTLKTLHLPYNPFSPSRIPSEFGNLTNLDRLWLTDCNIVGEIPDSLTRLSRLSNLDLAVNRLSGLIPSSRMEMESIYQIELYNNSFSSELPVKWSNTTTLKRFDVLMNELTVGRWAVNPCGFHHGAQRKILIRKVYRGDLDCVLHAHCFYPELIIVLYRVIKNMLERYIKVKAKSEEEEYY